MDTMSSRFSRMALGTLAVAWAACGAVFAQPPPQEDIRGPKPLVEIPVVEEPPVALWAGAAGGVLFLSAAAMAWAKFMRGKRKDTPRDAALNHLSALEVTGRSVEAEAFALRATGIVRQYISDHLGIAAPRRSTEEFLRDLAKQENASWMAEGEQLRAFLKSCDLAKFAGANLDDTRRAELIQSAREFVRATSTTGADAKGGKP